MRNKTFAPLEGDDRVTLLAGLIGTLSNDDDDNNSNVKSNKTTALHVHYAC